MKEGELLCLFLMNEVIPPSLTVLETEFSSWNSVKLWYHTIFICLVKLNLPGSLAGPGSFQWHQCHWWCPIFIPFTQEVNSTIIKMFWKCSSAFNEISLCPPVSCCSLRISIECQVPPEVIHITNTDNIRLLTSPVLLIRSPLPAPDLLHLTADVSLRVHPLPDSQLRYWQFYQFYYNSRYIWYAFCVKNFSCQILVWVHVISAFTC